MFPVWEGIKRLIPVYYIDAPNVKMFKNNVFMVPYLHMNSSFEYDPIKSETNNEKHGINFEEAQAVWEDKFALIVPTKNNEGENRFIIIGAINSKIWSIIFTNRRDKTRIISARRARKEEVYQYEKN